MAFRRDRGDWTWKKDASLTPVIMYDTHRSANDRSIYGVTVPAGKTLTLSLGLLLRAKQSPGNSYSAELTVNGPCSPRARCRPDHVHLVHDDSYGGDTNGDGVSVGPGSREWYGFGSARTSDGSVLNSANLRYSEQRASGGRCFVRLTNSVCKYHNYRGRLPDRESATEVDDPREAGSKTTRFLTAAWV